jgi:plastocyanin
MDRSRVLVVVAAAVTAITSVAALGAAVTSDDEGLDSPETVPGDTADLAGAVPVEIRDFTFVPADATVPAGSAVRWTNADGLAHTVVADDGTFASSNIEEGETYAFTFTDPGTYPYFCSIHESMRGTITVEG